MTPHQYVRCGGLGATLLLLGCAGPTPNQAATTSAAGMAATAGGVPSAGGAVTTAPIGGGGAGAGGGMIAMGEPSAGGGASGGSMPTQPEPQPEPGDASFHDVVPSTSMLGIYDTLKVTFHSSVTYTNPFDQDDIQADLVATAPDGTAVVMPAFYGSGSAGDTMWEAHFTPRQQGRYRYRAQITHGGSSVKSDEFTLDVAPSTLDGFLHLSKTSAYDLVFDSGKRFRGVGENFGWETDKYKFADMMPRLKQYNVNFVRTWEGPGRYLLQHGQPLSHFDPAVAAKLDQVMQLADDNGIYFMTTLEPAIYYLTTPNGGDVNVQWSANPFSADQGGPCAKTADFFTNATAKRHYKNKLRYAVARWGADPHIGVWEFFNEYDHLVEELGVPTLPIATWHQEMAAYLRKIDPYQHIITTSLSHNDYADLWSLPEMELTQRHLYGSTATLGATIAGYETKYQKPFVSGEFSLDWKWPLMHPVSEYGRELHLGLWRGMFAPTPILPLTWWWDFHADNNQYFHFQHASTMAAKTSEGPGPLGPQVVTATSGVEALALQSPNGRFVWIHNQGTGTLGGATVTLSGMPTSAFSMQSFDTWSGSWGTATNVQAENGSLQIDLPPLASDADMAYWLSAP